MGSIYRRARGKCNTCNTDVSKLIVDGAEVPDTLPCPKCKALTPVVTSADWNYSFRAPNGKTIRKKVGPDRRLALRAMQKREVEVAEGKHLDRRKAPDVATLGELVEHHLAAITGTRRPKCIENDRGLLHWTIAMLGGPEVRADTVTTAKLEELVRTVLKAGRRPSGIARKLAVLSGVFTRGVRDGLIPSRPRFPALRYENKKERFLTRQEALLVLGALASPFREYVALSLATGMRRGEILGLTPDMQSEGFLNLPGDLCKSRRGRRVPLNQAATDALPIIFAALKDPARPLKPCSIRVAIHRAIARTGVKPFRTHDLRHTAASWMVQAGVDLYSVALILGHESVAITKRYAHLAPGHLAKAIEATNLVLPAQTPVSTPVPTPVPTSEGEIQGRSNLLPFPGSEAKTGH